MIARKSLRGRRGPALGGGGRRPEVSPAPVSAAWAEPDVPAAPVRQRQWRRALPCLVAGLLSGCHQFGPASVQASRANYNEVINRTSNEQLLLNLVRLKYRDTPFFLEVSSLTNSFSFGAGLSTTGEYGRKPYFKSFGPYINYGERPTISYSPLQGDKFVKQLLSPLKLETLVVMYHSGWSVERVFRCCVQKMNGVKNAPSASGPTPDYVPTYEKFHRAAKIMRRLQKGGLMDLGADPAAKGGFAMRIVRTGAGSEDIRELEKILALKPGKPFYPLTTDVIGGDPEKIGVSTRSLLGVLFYHTQSVEAPLAAEMAGKVTITTREDGMPFDWTRVTGDVMRIRCSALRPRNRAVAVPYRGSWFYIADDDLNSKSTFSLLSQLFSLQAGQIKITHPFLMIPTGG